LEVTLLPDPEQLVHRGLIGVGKLVLANSDAATMRKSRTRFARIGLPGASVAA
jgi:hypothetical protein